VRKGSFVLVLHSHLPYVRMAGRWPHGEEMVHEAIAETYIPLLNVLNDLEAEGYSPRLTIGLTPILLEQIADPDVLEHFDTYLQERLALVEADIERHEREGNTALLVLSHFYRDWYRGIWNSFHDRYNGDIVGAFRFLQDKGCLDVLTSAATHGYLPLMERDSTIYAQIKVGIETTYRHMRKKPSGIWLPECGYRPAYMEGKKYKPGFEEFLADLNLSYFFTDTHVIEGGKMVGKVAGDAIGPYGAIPKRRVVVRADELPQPAQRTTHRPYYVQAARVAVFGRDERTGLQVWSASRGYPGDFVYREFHRKDEHSGLRYWRITGADVDLGRKDLYDPQRALDQTKMHAAHFVSLVEGEILDYYSATEKHGVVVSAYDAELFGHWWFEGLDWLKEVLRRLEESEIVDLTTARDYLEAYPPEEVMSLPESSWGEGGGHWTWLNPDTEWMWPLIHAAERQMEKLVARHPDAGGVLLDVLNQAARELLLLESSDWPFLISTGQAAEYATSRFRQHLARFNTLADIANRGEVGELDRRFLSNVMRMDNPFSRIDYRAFAEREKEGR